MTWSTSLVAIFISLLGFNTDVLADCGGSQPTSDVARLRQKLFCNYDKTVRPVKHHNTTTAVQIYMFLQSMEYNDYQGSIQLSAVWRVKWSDEHFIWNPVDYRGIDMLMIRSNSIWAPDLYLLNSAEQGGALQFQRCILWAYGEVYCVYQSKLSALCDSDSRRWPYDSRNCSLQLGSLRYSDQDVVFILSDTFSLESTSVNGEWRLDSVSTRNASTRYSCCDNVSYSVAEGEVVITRYPARHLAVVIGPVIVFAMMTLITFCMSPLREERLAVCCWNILCHFLYMHYVIELVFGSHSYSVPNIVLYFRDSLVMSVAALVLATVGRRYAAKMSPPYSFLVSAAGSMSRLVEMSTSLPFTVGIAHTRLVSSTEEGGGDNSALIDEPTNHEEVNWLHVVRLMDIVSLAIFMLLYFIFMLALLT